MQRTKILFLLVLLLLGKQSFSQKMYHGILVDSASVSELKDVHVKVKNSKKVTFSDSKGSFRIAALPTDTLIFSLIGYKSMELPLLFEEEILFVRMQEHIHTLKEVTVTAARLLPSSVVRSPRKKPTPMSPASAIFSPIDYFSRWQREKRKLLKLIEHNDRTITYLQVVMDQETREQLMEEFNLTELDYYTQLAKFNQQSGDLQYSTDPEKIKESLKTFLSNAAH